MSESKRFECRVCGRNILVRRDGKLRNHYPPAPSVRFMYTAKWCDGGGDHSAVVGGQPEQKEITE